MPRRKQPLPKSQRDLTKDQLTTSTTSSNNIADNTKNRAFQRSVSDSDVKRFNIGLRDIDETIVYYFKNVIQPSVFQNSNKVNVPVLYGSPERWKSVQRDGFYRDKNGKIQTPLIMFKRDSIEKNRNLGNKMDANSPTNFGIFKKPFSKKNIYDNFSLVTNREPVEEYYGVIIPDYVTITYSCIIFTNYIEQMNKIIEAINFASDSYWGDPERFSFRAMIDNYTTSTELNQGDDRVVKTNFSITMMGHIVPDSINAQIAGMNRFFSKSSVTFGLEVAGTLEELTARAGTAEKEASRRFFDRGESGTDTSGMTQEQKTYVSLERLYSSNVISTSVNTSTKQLTWFGITIATPPVGFPSLTKTDFKVFINGLIVETDAIDSITQSGGNVIVVFNDNLDFELSSNDEFSISGKFLA